MAPLRKTLAIDPGYYLVARPHVAAETPVEVVEEPQAGERYALLLRAADQRGLNRLNAPERPRDRVWRHVPPVSAATKTWLREAILDHVQSNPVFWLLHEPEVLRDEGYIFPGDIAWYVESEAGRAMHALIYEIRALECRLISHDEPGELHCSIYDRVTIEITRSVPLMEFPAVFPRQTAPAVPGLDQPVRIETDRVGDLMLATNARGYDYPLSTWALFLDRGDHALALLSGNEGMPEDEHFRCLWNLACPTVPEMVAAAQALVDSQR
jgi:hypothetical protein